MSINIKLNLAFDLVYIDRRGKLCRLRLLAASHSEALNAVREAWEAKIMMYASLKSPTAQLFLERREPTRSKSEAELLLSYVSLRSLFEKRSAFAQSLEKDFIKMVNCAPEYDINKSLAQLTTYRSQLDTLADLVSSEEARMTTLGIDLNPTNAQRLCDECTLSLNFWRATEELSRNTSNSGFDSLFDFKYSRDLEIPASRLSAELVK